jgi:iron complex transport system ATP-binding protein
MLEARNVSYQIGESRILSDISLRVEAGQIVALVGPNGAGKTTLLKLMSGDLHASSGQVLLDDRSLARFPMRELALRRAVMTQNAILSFDFTAYEVAMMGRYPHQRFGADGHSDDDAIVRESLQATETHHLSERLYPTLSGGESARVTLSRVLAQQTPILLLDEPTSALDLRHQQLVMQIARGLAAGGAALLMILHDLNLAAAHATHIGMMRNGQLYAEGAPSDVLTEESIAAVFDLPVRVMDHPDADCPLIVPLKP